MTIVGDLLQLFALLIFVRIILSWFPPPQGGFAVVVDLVYKSTEWALGPLRRLLPPIRLGGMALDLSPMILFFVLEVVAGRLGAGGGIL